MDLHLDCCPLLAPLYFDTAVIVNTGLCVARRPGDVLTFDPDTLRVALLYECQRLDTNTNTNTTANAAVTVTLRNMIAVIS